MQWFGDIFNLSLDLNIPKAIHTSKTSVLDFLFLFSYHIRIFHLYQPRFSIWLDMEYCPVNFLHLLGINLLTKLDETIFSNKFLGQENMRHFPSTTVYRRLTLDLKLISRTSWLTTVNLEYKCWSWHYYNLPNTPRGLRVYWPKGIFYLLIGYNGRMNHYLKPNSNV